MQFADRAARYPGLPAAARATVEQFFADVHAAKPELPVWVGSCTCRRIAAPTRRRAAPSAGNRLCELALREAEIWGTLGLCRGSTRRPAAAP